MEETFPTSRFCRQHFPKCACSGAQDSGIDGDFHAAATSTSALMSLTTPLKMSVAIAATDFLVYDEKFNLMIAVESEE